MTATVTIDTVHSVAAEFVTAVTAVTATVLADESP